MQVASQESDSSIRAVILSCVLILLILIVCEPIYADDKPMQLSEDFADHDPEHLQALLEKGLTLFELERELERIQVQLEHIHARMDQMNERMEQLQEEIEINHKRAGEVLRQYYMGQRLDFISMMLSARSIAEFFTIFDWVQLLLESDKRYLMQYQESLAEEKTLFAQLEEEQMLWMQLENNYAAELERVRTMQAELDRELEQSSNAAAIAAEIKRLTDEWQQIGLPWFQTYFQALSNAIVRLPDWILERSDRLQFERQHIAVHLTDDDLNEFLLEQNELFEGFLFQFSSDEIIVEGEREQLKVKIIGRYEHQYDEETGNRLDFIIDELYYNEFKLPETTGKDLKEAFDLSFYPDRMSPFLRFKDFAQEEGKLIIYFQL